MWKKQEKSWWVLDEVKIFNFDLLLLLSFRKHFVKVQYKLHPKSPLSATAVIEPSISSTFFTLFRQTCEKIGFTLLYQILSNLLKKLILHYNIRFSWKFIKKSKVVPLWFFKKWKSMIKIKDYLVSYFRCTMILSEISNIYFWLLNHNGYTL